MWVYVVFVHTYNETVLLGLFASEYRASQKKQEEEKNYTDHVIEIMKMEVQQ